MNKVWIGFTKNKSLWLAAVAVAIGVAAKFSLTTGQLLPGLDGAYYWVQVRSLLENQKLAFDDLPLLFWVQAAFAGLFGDIPTAVRFSDAVLPALAAIPIYLMTRSAKSAWLPAVTILVVLLFPAQLYFFTGDFIKNAAAIPVVFFISWILASWHTMPKRWSISGLALGLLVLGLTHFGTLLLALSIVGLWLLLQLRNRTWRFWVLSTLIALASTAAVLAGLAVLVPARYERLINFVTSPDVVFESPVWYMILHGFGEPSMAFTIGFAQVAALVLVVVSWRIRKALEFSQLSLVVSSLIVAVVFSSPLIGFEWSYRLAAMAFVPLAVTAVVLWPHLGRGWYKPVLWALALASLAASLLFYGQGAKRPVLSDAQYQEFKVLAKDAKLADNSVIVAAHGLEYLSAWQLKTHIVQDTFFDSTDLSGYSAVYAVEDKMHPSGYSGVLVFENDTFTLKKIR